MKKFKRIMSLVLSVLVIFSAVSVTSFSAESDFGYYFADENQTTVYISSYKDVVPSDGYIDIPEKINGYLVTGIAENAFTKVDGLKGVIIPETLVYIDGNAFMGDIDIQIKESEPEGVFDTEDWYDDHKQDYVISGTTLINYKGKDEIITIPYNCSVIADGAFKNNEEIKVVYFEKELESIGESAFEGCSSLTNIVAGNGVYSIEIGRNAFKDTPWLDEYPSDLVSIGTTLVKYKGTDSYVVIPNVFTAIADEAFFIEENDGSIASKVKVPVTVELFGDDCFYLYESISKVYPELVVFKNSAADKYCKSEKIGCTYGSLPGDIDGDGKTSASDARYVLRVSAKLERPIIDAAIKEVADISGDSRIAADDARLILRVSAKLDKYSAEDLLSIPRTEYEILFAATNALSLARSYGASYSKLAYQEITASDMNANTKLYLDIYKNELTSEKKSQTVTYAADSAEAYKNLFNISLIDASKVKEYTTVMKDGTYKFTLILKDETFNGKDVDVHSFTSQMVPVESVAHFTNKAKAKYWYNDSLDYNMTYNNCKLEMTVDIESHRIISMFVEMNYDFEITGKLSGIRISGSNGPATATRTDVIRYTNFNYFS